MAGSHTRVEPHGGTVMKQLHWDAERDGALAHRDFRLCQAWWASQDDEKGVRQIRNDDWYIVQPAQSPKGK